MIIVASTTPWWPSDATLLDLGPSMSFLRTRVLKAPSREAMMCVFRCLRVAQSKEMHDHSYGSSR